MRFWQSVDRWGPLAVSVLSILALIYYAWMTDQRMARLEGMVEARLQMESDLRTEMQTWQAYVFGLQKRMIETGVENVPDLPESLTKGRK